MFRTAYLSTAHELEVGRMVAAPEGAGFEAVFSEFHVKRFKFLKLRTLKTGGHDPNFACDRPGMC